MFECLYCYRPINSALDFCCDACERAYHIEIDINLDKVIPAAAIGAAAGAGTGAGISAIVGGIGIAAMGGAIGVGLWPLVAGGAAVGAVTLGVGALIGSSGNQQRRR